MKQLPAIDTTVDTFYAWIVKCNNLITLANTEMVTANNSANGAITTGTGFVIGKFGSNTIVCSTLSGGNTVTSGPITVTSNTAFANGVVVQVANGVSLGANNIALNTTARITTSNTSANQIVCTFPSTTYRSAKYVISVVDPIGSTYQSTELMLLQDGTNTYTTEYATLVSNSTLATFVADVNAGNVRLLATPSVANVQINVAMTLISV